MSLSGGFICNAGGCLYIYKYVSADGAIKLRYLLSCHRREGKDNSLYER